MKKRITLLTAGVLCAAGIAVGVAASEVIQEIKAQLRPDFTIVIDGEKKNFKNAQGEKVYPVLYEGTTYLPIRAIGELMGKTVYWYEDDKRIEFKDEQTTVTDADVIISGEDKGKEKPEKTVKPEKTQKAKKEVDKSAFIGEDAAKNIALEKAGLSTDDVRFVKSELDFDDGVWYYEIEFSKDREEYEAEIGAEDGKIIEWKKDID